MWPIILGLTAIGGAAYALTRKDESKGSAAPSGGNAGITPVSFTMTDYQSWPRVQASHGDVYAVAPEYIYPVGIGEAVNLAEQNGFELPTPKLVDLIWKAADLKVEPHPRTFKNYTQQEMSDPAVLADQKAYIENQIKGQNFRLLAGTHKDVVRETDGRIGLYGWHRQVGNTVTVIQPFFPGHALSWKDYSQGVRLVKKLPPQVA